MQSYPFALRPSGHQGILMCRCAGACRFVYNKALALQKERSEAGGKYPSYFQMTGWLVSWKKTEELRWLQETPSQSLQQALKNLDRAYQNFFSKRADFPRFKKKGQQDSFRYPQGVKLEPGNSRIYLPKMGWVRYRKSRDVLGEINNVPVSLKAGQWRVSIQTEREVQTPMHASTRIVGVDLGIAKLATLSDGTIYEPQNSYQKRQKRLAHYQRRMSRKQKFRENWKKARIKVQRCHQKIAAIRNHTLHPISHPISQNHARIVLEDLQVKNHSKSAKGTREKPGKNVRAKSGLNRSILDQGWGELRRQLEYKQAWRGGEVICIAPHYTRQTCAICGHIDAQNRKNQATFECTACGHQANADVNAARNILAAGHAVLACGGRVSRPMKQEPTEAIQAVA